MSDYMLTIVYDYGKLEHSAPLVDTWYLDNMESCISEMERLLLNGARFVSVSILEIPEGAR